MKRKMITEARWKYKKALAWEAYQRACTPARKIMEKIRTPLWHEYQKAIAPAEKQYEETTVPFFEEYETAIALALKEYEEETNSQNEEGDRKSRNLHKKIDKYL